ncbi:hypothetical protein CF65_01010 [Aggregatibacter actinomycetemcomitans HK1651]|nr:hypothetical protein CF65_01010 [Aggregatibacter actinomycetemcomitans HK1651]
MSGHFPEPKNYLLQLDAPCYGKNQDMIVGFVLLSSFTSLAFLKYL